MSRRIRRNGVISLVASSFLLGATVALAPAATATPAPATSTVRGVGDSTGAKSLDHGGFPDARIRPRTGDGPLEVTKEGDAVVMRIPLEGGGRLVVELTPDEADALSAELSAPAEPEQS